VTTVRVTPRQLAGELRRFGRDFDAAARIAGLDAAMQGAVRATELSPRASLTFASSWRARRAKDAGGVVAQLFSVARHAEFAEYGRPPGRMPPVGAILSWVRARGGLSGASAGQRRTKAREKARLSLAWAIARSIAKRGTKGAEVMEKVAPYVEERFAAAVNDRLRQVVMSGRGGSRRRS
jgi:hypothetical protein